ncbi:hypothetical protein LZT04_21830 [Vibrio fluvialis]|jgi:hypothetical protein|nr:hypothetical protein [Vibrio fluvialis]MCE7630497.1 hypothetical protein [Vibrio fluvialis]BEI24734.1 hypothetical protein KKIDH5335_30660 [Vibrio fluvialis]
MVRWQPEQTPALFLQAAIQGVFITADFFIEQTRNIPEVAELPNRKPDIFVVLPIAFANGHDYYKSK